MLADYHFELPEEQIARRPAATRDGSRLLHLPIRGPVAHRRFPDVEALLRPGDVLVVNDSRVLRARMEARKVDTGGRVEILLVEPAPGGWIALLGASKKVRGGQVLSLPGGEAVTVQDDLGEGLYLLRLPESAETLTGRYGSLPLPPYLGRPPDEADEERYQTVYAEGPERSVAAPTAGLHFTSGLLARLEAIGVERRAVTLHVGPGTFLPVRTEDESQHVMHAERYSVPPATAEAVRRARAERRRVVAVGTTAVRV
ncbi:MAG: S-adenosylmethionine:tRNA ribosyltransferase-isomerase, partial [Myxococcota bacterium]